MSGKEIHRCLKRYIARELYPLILADLAGAARFPWHRSVNSVAESFFSGLKKEGIRKRIYKTRDQASADIFDYIEVFYNRTWRHSHFRQVGPEAFERVTTLGGNLSSVSRLVQISYRTLCLIYSI